MAKEFELVRKIAVLGSREGGTTKEINIVRSRPAAPSVSKER